MRILAFTLAPLFLAGVSYSQSFNVDVGGGTPGTPLPSVTFGAGAAQPGTWNAIDPAVAGTPVLLANLGGAATAVTFARTVGTGGVFNSNNAGTTGDDEAFMDDCDFPPGNGSTWTFTGLSAGVYEVYTYAWAPDVATYQSSVSVNGGLPTCVGGPWTGVYTVGVTHALKTVTVAGGGSITLVFNSPACVTFHTFNGVQIKLTGTTSTIFCEGNGVGTSCLACGNNGAAGRGCANSTFANGTLLGTTGNASVGADTLALVTTDMTGPGLFFQANGLAASPIAFGDGQLCASVGILRLGVVFPTAGSATYPGGLTPNPITVGGGPILAGDTKHYQVWYRDAAAFCTASTFNTSNGVSLTWSP